MVAAVSPPDPLVVDEHAAGGRRVRKRRARLLAECVDTAVGGVPQRDVTAVPGEDGAHFGERAAVMTHALLHDGGDGGGEVEQVLLGERQLVRRAVARARCGVLAAEVSGTHQQSRRLQRDDKRVLTG